MCPSVVRCQIAANNLFASVIILFRLRMYPIKSGPPRTHSHCVSVSTLPLTRRPLLYRPDSLTAGPVSPARRGRLWRQLGAGLLGRRVAPGRHRHVPTHRHWRVSLTLRRSAGPGCWRCIPTCPIVCISSFPLFVYALSQPSWCQTSFARP